MKKKWYVREKQDISRYWEYEGEVEIEEEAKRIVKDGEVEPDEFYSDDYGAPIEIVDIHEIDED